jgi:hypothetical protein
MTATLPGQVGKNPPMVQSRKSPVAVAILATAALGAGMVSGSFASTSHAGWPEIDGDLKMHSNDQDGQLAATKLDKHNELLGGHGDDVIRAGKVGDVLWGDYKPGGQPTSQRDVIHGGPGKDFIYASHGHNDIWSHGGADQIHVHFGRGTVHCANSKPTVFISHKARKHYKLRGCKHISYKTVGH